MTAVPAAHTWRHSFSQACISVLCSLTSLEVSRISTPLGSPTLEDIFASLPALQSVCLGFCTNDLACATDSDSDAEGSQHLNCTRPDDFPHNLLRCHPSKYHAR